MPGTITTERQSGSNQLTSEEQERFQEYQRKRSLEARDTPSSKRSRNKKKIFRKGSPELSLQIPTSQSEIEKGNLVLRSYFLAEGEDDFLNDLRDDISNHNEFMSRYREFVNFLNDNPKMDFSLKVYLKLINTIHEFSSTLAEDFTLLFSKRSKDTDFSKASEDLTDLFENERIRYFLLFLRDKDSKNESLQSFCRKFAAIVPGFAKKEFEEITTELRTLSEEREGLQARLAEVKENMTELGIEIPPSPKKPSKERTDKELQNRLQELRGIMEDVRKRIVSFGIDLSPSPTPRRSGDVTLEGTPVLSEKNSRTASPIHK